MPVGPVDDLDLEHIPGGRDPAGVAPERLGGAPEPAALSAALSSAAERRAEVRAPADSVVNVSATVTTTEMRASHRVTDTSRRRLDHGSICPAFRWLRAPTKLETGSARVR
jgi:hypothetical protein